MGKKGCEGKIGVIEGVHSRRNRLAPDFRLGPIFLRDYVMADTALETPGNRGQNALYRTDGPGQFQFAEHHDAEFRFLHEHAVCRAKDGEGDGKVKRTALFPEVRRAQIDENPFPGKFKTRIPHCGAHSFTGFPDGSVGKADEIHRRDTAAQVGLNLDYFPFIPKVGKTDYFHGILRIPYRRDFHRWPNVD